MVSYSSSSLWETRCVLFILSFAIRSQSRFTGLLIRLKKLIWYRKTPTKVKNTIPILMFVIKVFDKEWAVIVNVERIPKLKSRECSIMLKSRHLYKPSVSTDAVNKRTKEVTLTAPMDITWLPEKLTAEKM